jgi:hypothetical protein
MSMPNAACVSRRSELTGVSAANLTNTQLSFQANPAIDPQGLSTSTPAITLSAVSSAIAIGNGGQNSLVMSGKSRYIMEDSWFEGVGSATSMFNVPDGQFTYQTVVALSIDWLAEKLPLPDLIKIDVEGAELEVIRGGLELLKSKKPVVLCEVGADSSLEVTECFKSIGYTLYDGESPLRERRELAAAPWSTIAIHRSGL